MDILDAYQPTWEMGAAMDENQPSTDRQLFDEYRLQNNQLSAALLVDRYSHPLLQSIRGALRFSAQRRFDPQDVEQSVWRTFFRQALTFQVNDNESLFPLLATLAFRKTVKRLRYNWRKRRDCRRESNENAGPIHLDLLEAKIAVSPSLMLEWQEAIQQLRPDLVRIVRMKLEGFTDGQIQRTIGLKERTYYRRLQDIRQALSDFLNSPSH